jgi:hypothetical protein
MFAAYRFESRDSDRIVRLGPWSYLRAGLFGGAYLVFKAGRWGLLPGVLVSIVFSAALALLILVTARFVPQSLQPVVLLLGAVAVVVVQSLRTSAMVRRAFHLHGWKVRRED